ncbi:hypothetical protein [Paracoccus tegillarcae]|uniref:Uncharacterized protein n=1 Tax=Paracoccus tegillarcae TaxID=1529068 RepID=A0A2K9EWP2_9RHOB|nr:hypothetical protein [Paracoccus tegillarcae]AUH33704.1 hypothetical protein CUV01_10165 [Paracoccus tegillarcae]
MIVSSFVFYGARPQGADSSISVVENLFEVVHVKGKEALFNVRTAPDDQGENLQLKEMDWHAFAAGQHAQNFRFVAESQTIELVGGVDDGTDVGFPTTDLSITAAAELGFENIMAVFRQITTDLRPKYGFFFTTDKVNTAISYMLTNGAALFPGTENPFAFTYDFSDWSGGPDSYAGSRLRMVYRHNLLNSHHMQINIDGQRLVEWIAADASRGTVIDLENEMFVWSVAEGQLAELNAALGHAGALISWKTASDKKKKRLPG